MLTDVYKRFLAGEEVEIWPSRGTNAVPIAFNPNTGLIYASTWNVPRIQKLAPPKPHVHRRGLDRRHSQASGSQTRAMFSVTLWRSIRSPARRNGRFPLTDLPSSAGMLATGGGLVFTGKLTGEFVALDEDTGKTLWQFKTGSSVNSTAITYTHKGRQYRDRRVGARRHSCHPLCGGEVADGGSVWTFALMPE